MADAKITALTALTSATADDILPIVDDPGGSPVTKKITYANLFGSFAVVGQLPFPATQIPSAGANTLDDYEEGTWTPTVTASSGTYTSVSAAGKYTKIGNLVFVWIVITITTNGTAAGFGKATLPFTPAAISSVAVFERVATGFAGTGDIHGVTASQVSWVRYDGVYLGGNNYSIEISGAYQV